MPDYVEDYPDMVEPAYILFKHNGSGAFVFGCVTGISSAVAPVAARPSPGTATTKRLVV